LSRWHWPERSRESCLLHRKTFFSPAGAAALKQRRFSRDVAQDIGWLLNQGRLLGVRAKLADKLDYVWRSCSGELTEQNDMFRLTYALETAKDMGWNYRVMSDREWAGRYALVLNPGVNGVYLLRTNLDAAFDDNGQQTNPLTARLTGSVAGVMKLLNRCGWQAEPESGASLPHQYSLMAGQGVPGKGISGGSAPGLLPSDRSLS
jgi:hypothetical protein